MIGRRSNSNSPATSMSPAAVGNAGRPRRLDQPGTSSEAYPSTPRPLLWLFLAYVLFLYLQGGVRFPVLGEIRLEFLMGVVLVPAAIMTLSKRGMPETQGVLGWSIALLVSMGLMVILSKFPAESWNIYWNRSIKFSLYGLCIAAFVSSPKDLRWFIGAFLLAFLKMGQEGFTGTLDGSLIWENQEIPRLHGATPNYAHPNSFSGTQLGVLPFLYYLYPLMPWYLRLAILVQGMFCANVVLRTGSRTGYLGLLAAVASVVWLSTKRFRAAMVVVVAILIIVPLLPAEYLGRFETIFVDHSVAGEDTSVGKRKEILEDALQVLASNPWGIGVGAFPLVRAQLFGRSQDTHNLYLEVATNLGVHGFIVFVGFVLCLWKVLRRLQRNLQRQIIFMEALPPENAAANEHRQDLKFMLACARATWIFLIIRLVLGLFGMDMYETYWWFVAGMSLALLTINRTAVERTSAMVGRNVRAEVEVRGIVQRRPVRAPMVRP